MRLKAFKIIFTLSILTTLMASCGSNNSKGEAAQTENNQANGFTYEIVEVNNVKIELAKVKGGMFIMGANVARDSDAFEWESPEHEVVVPDFLIGKTEVTQALWEAVMGNNPSKFKNPNYPVESVSWNECIEFIGKLNQLTGKEFRLPTEEEWEYAARGGQESKGYKYSGSNNIDDVAWYVENSGKSHHAVAQKQPNELGLYDMSGNVLEFCDGAFGKYGGDINPAWRIARGGSIACMARLCRVTDRSLHYPADKKNICLGLRLCL